MWSVGGSVYSSACLPALSSPRRSDGRVCGCVCVDGWMDPSAHHDTFITRAAFCILLAREKDRIHHTHTHTHACRAVLSVDYGWFDRGQAG